MCSVCAICTVNFSFLYNVRQKGEDHVIHIISQAQIAGLKHKEYYDWYNYIYHVTTLNFPPFKIQIKLESGGL